MVHMLMYVYMCVRVCVNVCITNIQYGSITVVASWWEQVMVVLLAVRLPVPLKEVPGAYLLLAVGAHKVLGVPRSAHGRYHLVWGHSALN